MPLRSRLETQKTQKTTKTTNVKQSDKGHCPTFRERFWDRVEVLSSDGCWLWTGGTTSDGYGVVSVTQRGNVAAHRMAWELEYGKPDGFVLRKCRVPLCVNPGHMYLSSTTRDSTSAAGVLAKREGARKRLSDDDVRQIRRMYTQPLGPGHYDELRPTQQALADHFGVSRATISAILNGRTKKGVT